MPRQGPDPLADTVLLLVDGSNLLHALRRGQAPLPAAALIGRLRAAIPAATAIELHLDGAPEPGMRRQRIASGLTVRHSGPSSADAAILGRVERLDALAAEAVLVVTDDRELRHHLARRGARTAGSRWLIGRLERVPLAAPVSGNPRPGRGAAGSRRGGIGPPAVSRPGTGGAASADDEPEAPRWQPGRGATAKRGNPRRTRRSRG